ncbi:hypothetical protein SELMODRAFT_426141 [Selaginella moellendorffii]|uniref:Ceramidase n=1 Tax=Selaginella moellendorffii TaxID=88036 RepID=D8SVG1_SELML|nr:uncharacterized protein LOC9658100 isoform X1 [Selaginella moellendorffii]EFJ11664.1 hypothetical protein SELMODRAFT_426141 [Selaginella moellendorffii]|eukprot:XP_002987349.1 uncharacterized protein LOC9658100 isoform X1 [Selaginella moellendorffii]
MASSKALLWVAALLLFLLLMLVTPRIPQDQDYHDFADHRAMLGIPNALNVVSNFPFLVIGAVGMVLTLQGRSFRLSLEGEVLGWTWFFLGVAATAFGSSYYHLHPDDSRLVWDRLPMTISFTAIMAVFVIERVDDRTGKASVFPLLAAGALSVAYWRFADDLRPYALVQFVPCIAIPVMTLTMPPQYTHSLYWLWAAGCYLLAKVAEASDNQIYRWTGHLVSGHTLKHLLAALVPVFIMIMLARREEAVDKVCIMTKLRNHSRVRRLCGKEEGSEQDDTEANLLTNSVP